MDKIKTWLRRLVGKRPQAGRAAVVGVPYPDWTADDRFWLETILKDPRGQKLHTLLYFKLQGEAFSIRERGAFDVGRTAGMSEMIGYLEVLAERIDHDE